MSLRLLGPVLALALCCCRIKAADHSVEPIPSRIQRQPIESTAVAAIGYSKRLHALEIEFRDGLIYRYLEVPPSTYRQLMAAESKTRFYNNHLRGRYRCLRVKAARRK